MMQPKLLFALACSWIALLCCFSQAQAQQNSVGLVPASIEAKVRRGASYTQTFALTNNTGTRLRFHCSVGDVWYNQSNQRVTGRAGALPRSASLWVQFTPTEVIVEPHSSASVRAVITIPQDAAGGYYTMPIFEGMPADLPPAGAVQPAQGSTATASIGMRFRGLMMLTTEDAAEYNVEIMGGQISPPTASSEFGIQLDVLNRGTAHARVQGAFAILNASGALAGRGTIEGKRLLPGQRNNLGAGWLGELPPGSYTCVITLSYNRVGMEPSALVYELPFKVR